MPQTSATNVNEALARPRIARYLDRFIFYALLAAIALTAIPYGTVEPWWKAVFVCAVLALGSLWIVEGTLSGEWFVRQHRLLIPLMGLAVFTVGQMTVPLRKSVTSGSGLRPISFAPYDTRMVAFQLLALVATGGLLLRYTNSRRRVKALVYVAIGIGFTSTLFGLARKAFQHGAGFLLPYLQPDDGTVTRGVGFAQFINHNHFAFLAEMSLGLVLGLMLRRPTRFIHLVWGAAVAMPMWVAVVYSGTRGGLVSIVGQVLFVALLVFVARPGRQLLQEGERHQRLRRFGPFLVTRVVLIASFAFVMVLGIVWVGGDPLAAHLESVPQELGVTDSDKYTRTHRSTIWPMTWQMIKDHPIAGVGFGAYWIAITKYHHGSGAMTPQEAHNDYLELLASGGLIAAAIGLWFVAVFLKEVVIHWRHSGAVFRAYAVGALAGMFAVAIHSIFDFGLHVTINSVLFVALAVIATVTVPAADQANETDPAAG